MPAGPDERLTSAIGFGGVSRRCCTDLAKYLGATGLDTVGARTGAGGLLLSSYGAIIATQLDPGETLTLDTGHVVAFDESVQYSVRKAGSWKSTLLLGGEGLVTDYRGPGRVCCRPGRATT